MALGYGPSHGVYNRSMMRWVITITVVVEDNKLNFEE